MRKANLLFRVADNRPVSIPPLLFPSAYAVR